MTASLIGLCSSFTPRRYQRRMWNRQLACTLTRIPYWNHSQNATSVRTSGLRYSELTRKLHRLGYVLDRRARGDHEIWIRPSTGGRTTIPNWGARELKTGTVRAILRDLGVTRQEFDRA